MSAERLSPQLTAVLELLLAGHDLHEVADHLVLSRHTVAHHTRQLRIRHGARHTLHLVALVHQQRAAALRAELDECQRALAVLDRRGRGGVGERDAP